MILFQLNNMIPAFHRTYFSFVYIYIYIYIHCVHPIMLMRMRLTGVGYFVPPERNVLETPKLVERLHTPRTIMRSSFKVKDKGQGHQADIMLRPEMRHIFRTERSTNFKLGVVRQWSMRYQLSRPAVKLGSCTRAGTYPATTQLV